ncbi:hypothetical protein KUV51_14085 [Tateyamaria omphalii]|uniref:hypothetical protein n=1 Tax=Tateyamaria omphalii TaxID=299262 RepID=UPI001C98FCDC|nr:hypothetical protein [Tateyamaria omphalii]MBY5934134.1 hypothetical protein [Tateyamaria omphalii]
MACFLAPAFRAAQSWSELLDALERTGFWLGFEEDDLVLIQLETGLTLCKCTAIGHSFADLRIKMGKPRVEAGSMRVADNSLCAP